MRAHARAMVASACRACGEPQTAQRSTRRYCTSACRLRAYRADRKPMLARIAHQRRIRDIEAARDPRPQMASLEGCAVAGIPYAEAKAIITRYEWLSSMPAAPRACYGLKDPSGELIGVAAFAAGPAPESGDICGREHRDDAVCLARGACVHWAHPHAASFLISRACKLASKQFGWKIFYAYADPRAGEIGTGLSSLQPALSRQRRRTQQGPWPPTVLQSPGRPMALGARLAQAKVGACRSSRTSRMDCRMDARQRPLRVVRRHRA
jgi:hypothetical protein